MKLIDPAANLDGSGPTVELLLTPGPPVRAGRWPRRRWVRGPALLRLRVLDSAGQPVLDVDERTMRLLVEYSGE